MHVELVSSRSTEYFTQIYLGEKGKEKKDVGVWGGGRGVFFSFFFFLFLSEKAKSKKQKAK